MFNPLLQFRIYPNPRNRNLYYLVRIFKHFKELRSYEKNPTGQTLAFVDAPKFNTKEIGTINFCAKRLGMEIITHESTHAAVRYISRIKNNFDLKFKAGFANYEEANREWSSEEYLCLVVGRIASQINSKLYKKGVYK